MGQQEGGHSTDKMAFSAPDQAVQALPAMGSRIASVEDPMHPHRLFDSHLPFVWRNLRRLGVPDALVEDATQDVFLVVHRRWDSWQAERSTVETWLFGIVLRVARNYRRAQKRRLAWLLPAHDRSIQEAASQADGPAEILAQRQAAALFERAVAKLDENLRAVFLMVDVEEMTVPQAVSALGINLNTGYWRLRKARMAFRRALAKLQATDDELGRRSRP
jgi:RNA polymerase sigma-70 factor (ECF subfamily)